MSASTDRDLPTGVIANAMQHIDMMIEASVEVSATLSKIVLIKIPRRPAASGAITPSISSALSNEAAAVATTTTGSPRPQRCREISSVPVQCHQSEYDPDQVESPLLDVNVIDNEDAFAKNHRGAAENTVACRSDRLLLNQSQAHHGGRAEDQQLNNGDPSEKLHT